MKKAFLVRSIIIIIITIMLFSIISIICINYINRRTAEDNINNYMSIYADEINDGVSYSEIASLSDNLKNKIRITIIASDGAVIADSTANVSDMENHYNREEIVSARNSEDKKFVRSSDTLNIDMMYYARVLDNGDYLRIAIPLSIINHYFTGYFIIILMLMLIVGILVILISIRLNNSLLLPLYAIRTTLLNINSGNYSKILPSTKYEEVNLILNQVDELSNNIRSTLMQYDLEKNKLYYVLENINQGIIAVDKDNKIVLINRTAEEFFNIDDTVIGKSIEYLFSTDELIKNIEIINQLGGIKTLYYTVDDSIYYCSISTVGNNKLNDDISVIVLITDVTVIKTNEKIREEFFTNSSHELKTPLTAIKGFAELLSSPDVASENIIRYSELINKNIDRMISLINDMIDLSMIDNNVINEEMIKIDLKKMVDDVINDYINKAKETNITIDIEGEAEIQCYPNKTRELISNLVDNSIKYNKQDGSVNINIIDEKYTVIFSIEDSGIGIEEKYHSRLFERFFRVDKGRSRKIGGTGLGLSIVKHICIIHNWEIELISHLGVGTTIKIYIKK